MTNLSGAWTDPPVRPAGPWFRLFRFAMLGLAVAGLHLSAAYSFLFFHSLAEILRTVALFGVFVLAWHSRRWSKNNYIVLIGISYLFIGSLELLHALAYKGMGVFAGYDADLPTQLWIAFRYLEAVSFVIAPLVIHSRLHPPVTFIAYFLATVALAAAIFGGAFPAAFVEGEGLTPFKINSEYAISALFLLSIVLLLRVRRSFDHRILIRLVAALALGAAAEIAFTQYASVYGAANEAGHLLLLLSTYCVYRGVLVAGIVDPFSLLFRSLKQKEAELEAALSSRTAALKTSEERAEALAKARVAEMKLHAADARLASIIRSSSDAIVSYSSDGVVQSWNGAAERMFGYSAQEAIGRDISFIVPPDSTDGPRGVFDRAIAGEQVVAERTRRRKDGSSIEVIISAAPICNAAGAPIGVSGVMHDITERKRREEHIEFLMREISHRSKNLLSVVMAISSQTARHCAELDDFQTRFAGRLQSLAQSHDALVNQNWRGVELDRLAGAQLDAFDMSRFEVRGSTVRLNPTMAQHIGLAFHELATNAAKYGALSVPEGRVAIRADIDHDDTLSITWTERGGPVVKEPKRKGFGTSVLASRVFASAEVTLEFRPEGVRWRLSAPTAYVTDQYCHSWAEAERAPRRKP